MLQERVLPLKYASWWNLVLIVGKEENLEQNLTLCFCYRSGKGHQLVFLSLAGQTLDV